MEVEETPSFVPSFPFVSVHENDDDGFREKGRETQTKEGTKRTHIRLRNEEVKEQKSLRLSSPQGEGEKEEGNFLYYIFISAVR